MKLLSKVTNPVALVLQGFVVGAFAFVLANPQLLDSHSRISPDSEALVRDLTR